jgi:hypothetical protein
MSVYATAEGMVAIDRQMSRKVVDSLLALS